MQPNSQNTKNAFMVISSNILTIAMALFTGFILPKQMSIDDYSYYKVYYLYIAYAGFFHLGLVNGIYLKYGNMDMDMLPKGVFRKFGHYMYYLQAAVCVILAIILYTSSFHMDANKVLAYAFVIINIPLVNIKWFYSSINQFTKRFVIDSYVTYFQNAFNFAMVLVILWMKLYAYWYILILTTIMNLLIMLVVMYQNRIIIVGKTQSVERQEVSQLIKSGFFLMISEFVGIIILGIDSMFVTGLFTKREFAMYSFAVSIISVIYTLISTVSNLIYPYLVRVEKEKYAKYYVVMSDSLTIVSVFSLLAFYAAKFIVVMWIDKYTESIAITAILFGTIIFRSIIMLVCGNYFKVLKMIKEYTKNNVFAITISFVLDVLAYVIFKEYHYIAVASLISFIIWYLVTDRVFIKRLNISKLSCVKRYICITISLVVFYALLETPIFTAFFIYFACACFICVLCFHKEMGKMVDLVKAKNNRK